MSNLSISLLGSPRIEQDGSPITVDTRKAIALVAFLAVTNRAHERDRLARLLWGSDLPRARAALRRTLSVLKKALAGNWLYLENEVVGLRRESGFWLDVELFLARLAAYGAHQHPAGDVCPSCLPFLQEAVSLYRDSFLAGFLLGDAAGFGQWQMAEAAFFQRKQAKALEALSLYHAQTGEYDTAVTFAHRWLQLDPTHEPGHQWLMKLYAWQGQPAKAHHQYYDCVRLLKQSVGLPPQPETIALFHHIQNGRQPDKPVANHPHTRFTPPAPFFDTDRLFLSHNLPVQLTPLIGREVELGEIKARFHNPRCRLLTITGMGGAGKTRLALEFAWQQKESFRHGAYFIPLAAIDSTDYLITTLADAFQISLSGADAKKQLLHYLAEKEMLLVLDNFEHLLDEADLLLEILRQAPGVKFLVTSRTCLNFQVEWLYEVGGLTYAHEDDATTNHYGAVALFLYHANRIQPRFTQTAEEMTAVHHICQLLGGIPLGLELAAALLRQFSGAEIAAGITQNLDFLKTTMRDVPLEHRSLRAVFAHSWRLLTPAEQNLLQQLAIFHGDFSREAAHAVTHAEPALLLTLVNKSLLQEKANGCYEMHSLIQQYAREKLQADEPAATRLSRRHGQYFLTFLQHQTDDLKTAVQGHALAAIRKEIDNVHVAWHWAVNQKEEAELDPALDGLCLFYDFSSWYYEGKKVFETAADKLSAKTPGSIIETRLRARQALFMHRLSLYEQAKTLLLDCLSVFRQQPLLLDTLFCLIQLGTVAFFLGEYDEAKAYLHESLAIGQKTEEPWYLAYCYNSLGNLYRVLGSYEAAYQCFEQALHLRRECGDKRGIAVTLNNLGSVAETVGDYEEARRLLKESLLLKEESGDRKGVAVSMLNLGRVLSLSGRATEGQKLLANSFVIFKEVGELAGAALAITNQGNIAYAANQLTEAGHYYAESLKISQTINDRRGIVFSLNDLGKVALAQHNCTDSQAYFCQALSLAAEMKSTPQMLEALAGLADLLQRCGESAKAMDVLRCVLHHQALDRETREYAGALKVELESQRATAVSSSVWQSQPDHDLFAEAQNILHWLAGRELSATTLLKGDSQIVHR